MSCRAAGSYGFSLVEIVVACGIIAVVVIAMASLFQSQMQAQQTIETHADYEAIKNEIRNVVTSVPNFCKCSFEGNSFSTASLPAVLNWSAPKRIGYFQFVTPGDCATATLHKTIVEEGLVTSGIRATLLSVEDIVSTGSPNTYVGWLTYQGRVEKNILGGRDLKALSVPITFSVTEAAGTATVVGCQGSSSPSNFSFGGPGVGATVTPLHGSAQTVSFGLPAGTKGVLVSYTIGSMTGDPGSDRQDRYCLISTDLNGSPLSFYLGYNSRGDGEAHGVAGTAVVPLRSNGTFTLSCFNPSSAGVVRAMAAVN